MCGRWPTTADWTCQDLPALKAFMLHMIMQINDAAVDGQYENILAGLASEHDKKQGPTTASVNLIDSP
jgi:hypothetical protein